MIEKEQIIKVAQIMGKWVGGGVETVVMNYYRNINRNKFQFDFIFDEDSKEIPYEEIEKLGGKVILIPPYQKIFKYHRELRKVLKEGNYKIVHSHINTLSIFSLFAAKRAGVPVRIAHSHSTTSKKEKKKNFIKQILKPFSKLFATNYICCSELAGRWMFGNKEYDSNNVHILNNAINLEKFKYNEEMRIHKRKELVVDDNTLVVGHVGRFVEQKNHNFLLDVFNEIHKINNDSILLLVGKGPLINEIKEKVNKLKLQECVVFLGQRTDINELYQAMDVFLLPSLYEGLPVVGIEAQAAGLLCELSDDMTKEAKVLETTRFISLESSAEQWAKLIMDDYLKFKRKDTEEEITKNKFNIKNEGIKLEKLYESFLLKKVVFVLPDFSIGGAEKMVSIISLNLDKDKFIPQILIIKNKRNNYLEKETISKIETHFLNKNSGFDIKTFIYAYRKLKKLKPNIIHTHLQSFLYIVPYAILNKIKIIHTIHCEPTREGTTIHRKILQLLINKNIVIPVAISDELGKATEKYYKIKKCNIIYNPVDTKTFRPEKKQRKNEKIIKFINIGRLVKEKNQELLILGIKKLHETYSNIRLDIIGEGVLKDDLQKIITNNHAENYIKLLGSRSDIANLLNESDIFALTSTTEGMPMTLLEAMACGKPIICSCVGGIPDVIKNNGYLFESNNINDFVNKAASMISKPEIIQKMKRESLEISKKYDITVIANQYGNLYEKYMRGK